MADTLQDFLISIGYKVDEAAERKVQGGLKTNTFLAVELGKAFLQAAKSVEDAARRMSAAMDDLYFASLRTNTSVVNLKAMAFAAGQLGSSGQAAMSALESVAKLMATNPAGEGFLNSLGVKTRDANHQLMDTSAIMSNLGRVLKDMPLPTANYIANFLGIDYKQLLAMRAGLDGFEAEYKSMYAAAHINSAQAAKDAHYLANETRSLSAAFGILGDKVAAEMSHRMADDIKRFRMFLVAHFDDIARIITYVVEKVLMFADALTTLLVSGGQAIAGVIRWFDGLDKNSKTLIETFGLILVAWRVLNTGFLATPLGMVLALGAALALLYQDYQVWKDGGKSLINWGQWQGELKAAGDGITGIIKVFGELWHAITADLLPAIEHLFTALGLLASPPGIKADGDSATTRLIKGMTEDVEGLIRALTLSLKLISAVASGDWGKALEILGEGQSLLPDFAGNRQANREAGNAAGGLLNWWDRTMPGFLGGGGAAGGQVVHPGAGLSVDKQKAGQESYAFWKGKGFSDGGAAAMAAMEMGESGGNPAARGDKDKNGVFQAHGLYEWHEDRRNAILKRTGINVSTASAAEQREAMFREMSEGIDGRSGMAYNRIKNAPDSNTGVSLGVSEVERSANQAADINLRAGYANDILARARTLAATGDHAPVVQAAIADRMARLRKLGAGINERTGEDPSATIAPPLLPANAAAGDSGPHMTLTQETNINIEGGGDPNAIGDSVRRAQDRVNASAARNLTGAVR